MYRIREAKTTDYSAVHQLNHSENVLLLRENDCEIEAGNFEASLNDENARWYVVEKSGELLAFIFFLLEIENGGVQIKQFTVDADYGKKGLNEHLYKKLEQVAARRQADYMQADISQTQQEVIAFFDQKGWEKEGNCYIRYLK